MKVLLVTYAIFAAVLSSTAHARSAETTHTELVAGTSNGGSTTVSAKETNVEDGEVGSSENSVKVSGSGNEGDFTSTTVHKTNVDHTGSDVVSTTTITATTTLADLMEEEYYLIMQRMVELIVLPPGVPATYDNIQAAADELLPAYNDLINSLYSDDCERYVVAIKVTHWEVIDDDRRQLRGAKNLDTDHGNFGAAEGTAVVDMSHRKLYHRKSSLTVRSHVSVVGTCSAACAPNNPKLANSVSGRRLSSDINSQIPTLKELLDAHNKRLGDIDIDKLGGYHTSTAAESAVASFNGEVHETYVQALEERVEELIKDLEEKKAEKESASRSYKRRVENSKSSDPVASARLQKIADAASAEAAELAVKITNLEIKIGLIRRELKDTRDEQPALDNDAATRKASLKSANTPKKKFEYNLITEEEDVMHVAVAAADIVNFNKASQL